MRSLENPMSRTLAPFLFLGLGACIFVLPEEGAEKPPGGGADPGDLSASALQVGECQDTPDRRGPSVDTAGWEPTPTATAAVDGDDVVVHLDEVYANCCPSPGATATYEDGTIVVQFHDVTTEDPCDCMCVFDFDVRLDDVPSGHWTVEVYDDGEYLDTTDVTVP